MIRALIPMTFGLAAAAGAAQAQIAPVYPPTGGSAHAWQAEQHRYEIDRLRARADQREAFARQLQLETRLNRLEIQAARQPEVVEQPETRALRSPEEERALRESAARRRRAATAGLGEIDAWLDRAAD